MTDAVRERSPRPAVALTPEQRRRENSLLFLTIFDALMLAMLAVGMAGGSHTVTAELLRGFPGWLLDIFSLVVVRRIHRGVLADMEYGSGKLEQVAGVAVGLGMLFAAAWIAADALALVAGDKPVGSPLGLAAAAACGMVNLLCNVVTWDAVRRVGSDGSAVMQAQLVSRLVKMVSSIIVQVTLTIAAMSTDSVVIAWADGIGALIVSSYIALSGAAILRAALPDLIDRSAGRETLDTIATALTRHGGGVWQARRIRTRRSGPFTFVEITLAFDAALRVGDIEPRVQALKDELAAALGQAEVLVEYVAA